MFTLGSTSVFAPDSVYRSWPGSVVRYGRSSFLLLLVPFACNRHLAPSNALHCCIRQPSAHSRVASFTRIRFLPRYILSLVVYVWSNIFCGTAFCLFLTARQRRTLLAFVIFATANILRWQLPPRPEHGFALLHQAASQAMQDSEPHDNHCRAKGFV